ncbi:MAG: hypothetical protein HC905_22900 [Bacteroidales bacterium]|nr:hypothetical protein [Bacteroidales bacterium]
MVRTRSIGETFEPVIMLPDTLMFTSIDMDPEKPSNIPIPSSLFQKANTSYEILVSVLNSQNQRMERIANAEFIYSRYELTHHFSHDSICFNILYNDVPLENIPAVIHRDGELNGKKFPCHIGKR